MANSNTNEMIIQPNPYAGGRPEQPLVMPLSQPNVSGAGGNSSAGNQGQGGNSVVLDGDVSFQGPSAGLSGTPQESAPFPGGDVRPTTPSTEFINTVVGMEQSVNNVNGGQASSSEAGTGWRRTGEAWYYIDPGSRTLAKGWRQIEGLWYYLEPDSGAMVTGWRKLDGLWYHFHTERGDMETGWKYIDGQWYYLETDGAGAGQMVTGWKQDGEKWYFLHADGAMAYGTWLLLEEKWYHFETNGEMSVNKIVSSDGKKFYVHADGAMVTKAVMPEVTCQGVTYEVAEDGVCTANSMTAPADANIQAWREYITNDASLSEARKTIVLEALETIEQGCVYHQLRKGYKNPTNCMGGCDAEINPEQAGAYNFDTMANYNLEDPLYLDCSFFVKHCYWKAGIEMEESTTKGMFYGKVFVDTEKNKMKPADIAVRYNKNKGNGHVILFVGWTSEHKMVWAEMKGHEVNGVVSSYTPDESIYQYRKYKYLD